MTIATDINSQDYNNAVEELRDKEFPMLSETIYLDHAGTAIPPKSLIETFATNTITNLRGNPHSTSSAAQNTSKKIESIRLQLLAYFRADPELFDLVFVPNATAGIKLVADAFRDAENAFWFGYHHASHTSVVGVRELAANQHCFQSDTEVEEWLQSLKSSSSPDYVQNLFAYPAQSNMNGTRLSLDWCKRIREARQTRSIYSLLDAAAFVSTSPLDLSEPESGPDFTVLSLYKMFGFPELGALIVRKSSAKPLRIRKYFGGGTVDTVLCSEKWHARKTGSLHEALEDGSLPIHNILAIEPALQTYSDLFGSLDRVSRHCAFLAQRLYLGLSKLRHGNGLPVCHFYHGTAENAFADRSRQGPILAFNIRDSQAGWVGTTEIEKLASIKRFQLRTGGLCNPGGVAAALDLSPQDMKRNFADGLRCGNDADIMRHRPTGMIRVSLGPSNTKQDVDSFAAFVEEFFVELDAPSLNGMHMHCQNPKAFSPAPFVVEHLMIYPIKSCSGWMVPRNKPWRVYSEGLAWDREWCVILAGSGAVMCQKRYPKMALIRPELDLDEGLLRVHYADVSANIPPIAIPLYLDPNSALMTAGCPRGVRVCGDDISARTYSSPYIIEFFTKALGVACHLVRFPPGGILASSRHAKPHMRSERISQPRRAPGGASAAAHNATEAIPLLLSNESPVLTISQSSINRLNEQIKMNGGKAVRAEAFRANIVLSELEASSRGGEHPFAEDTWQMMRVGSEYFELLGPCRRCQMVCIDQSTGERNQEPFVTLAKTRRFDGKVLFGQHSRHIPNRLLAKGDKGDRADRADVLATITAGDAVFPIV